MSGNFDYPPASEDGASSARSNPILQSVVRNLERDREAERTARDQAFHERQDNYLEVPMPPRRARVEPPRRRTQRRQVPREAGDASLRRLPPPIPPSNTLRPRAVPSERFRRQRLEREQRANDEMDRFGDFDLRFTGDSDVPNLFSFGFPSASSPNRRSPPADIEGLRRRVKRRKLEHENSIPSTDGFKYGHYGQIVPGRLKMEIVSCDGGEYDGRSSQGLHKIENVLKNDKSVYCTQSSQCNLLLRHHGDTTFCLEKVVIKAPERGFTAPLQEGMIFVSMSSEELLNGTSGYKIEYDASSPQHPSSSSHDEELLTFEESLNDPEVWANSRAGREEAMERQIERLDLRPHQIERLERQRRYEEQRAQIRRRMLDRLRERLPPPPLSNRASSNPTENCEWPVTEPFSSIAAGVSAPTPPPFTVTTESDVESDFDEDQPSAAVMADRLRRDSRWRAESDDDDDDYLPLIAGSWASDRRREDAGPLRASRLRTPSRIGLAGESAESETMVAPHAKFFIARHKITIKFDPPVSGKFVLLKLWSPHDEGNIDIESVLFHGYSGPRYFPACELR